jgi:hypothetical protein
MEGGMKKLFDAALTWAFVFGASATIWLGPGTAGPAVQDEPFRVVADFVAAMENTSGDEPVSAAVWTALSAAYFLEATLS